MDLKKLKKLFNYEDETFILYNLTFQINVCGFDPSSYDNLAISLASDNGHVDVVKELLKDKRVDPSDNNNFAIKLASQNGHLEIVKELLKHPKVDPSSYNSKTIRWASKNGHTEVVKVLNQYIKQKEKVKCLVHNKNNMVDKFIEDFSLGTLRNLYDFDSEARKDFYHQLQQRFKNSSFKELYFVFIFLKTKYQLKPDPDYIFDIMLDKSNEENIIDNCKLFIEIIDDMEEILEICSKRKGIEKLKNYVEKNLF